MKSKQQRKAIKKNIPDKTIRNKRARFDYELGDSFVVGVALNGRETKSLRMGHGQLQGAYVTVKDDELFLINASIHGTTGIPIEDSEVTRARKLLAKRKEIDQLITAKKQGRTIVPVDILTRGRYIKVRIALGKGKKDYDKRHDLKKRAVDIDIRRDLKSL
ncbi:MAG: SsrA-binding protein SmpB [Candidatus Saccharibacteria bacterium]|nr:SsrA-binding protein SmpB [Candidatus Saccharibacteria bacterium]